MLSHVGLQITLSLLQCCILGRESKMILQYVCIMIFTFTLAEIIQEAAKIYKAANGKKVWAIHGEMGAGKTTFIHALCQHLGVSSAIGSPTYSIINEYEGNTGIIFHIDLYRLKDEEEALQAGVEECIISQNLCLIEWPERALNLFPDNCFHLTIKTVNHDLREISYKG